MLAGYSGGQLDSLRILVIEPDGQRADELTAQFSSAGHFAISLASLEEAAEALSLQNFETVLLASPQTADAIERFSSHLRALETGQGKRAGVRTAILAFPEAVENAAHVDCVLPPNFDPASLPEVLQAHSQAVPGGSSAASPRSDLLDFEPAAFEEQCGHEAELMVEIIDLFFTECAEEVPAMREALAHDDFDRLSRVTHTLKGSLGSLHAHRAREQAQGLEMAAKAHNRALCVDELALLEEALESLSEPLKAFRSVCAAG